MIRKYIQIKLINYAFTFLLYIDATIEGKIGNILSKVDILIRHVCRIHNLEKGGNLTNLFEKYIEEKKMRTYL